MTRVPDWQRRVHVVTEVASVLLVPVVWVAANHASEPHRSRLKALAVGMLVVDGLLLLTWLTRR